MKRLFALILILVLAFTLAACGEKKDDGEKQITLAFNTNNLTNETMTFMVDVMKKYCDEHNIKFLNSQCGGDVATLQNNLENFVAGGVDGIVFMNYDEAGIEPLLLDLKEKGIALVSYDEESEICDYSFCCSNYDLGLAIGTMAAEWANEHVQGEAKMGLLSVEGAQFLKVRSDGIQDGYNKTIKNGTTIRQPISGGGALDTYANMLSADPDIKIFTSIADSVVVGVAEAWYGDLVGAGADISQYGVFSTDATDIALNLVNQAKNGKGTYRGTIDLGLKTWIPLGMIQCCHAAVLGVPAEGWEKVNYYKVKYVMEDNIDEYSEFLD